VASRSARLPKPATAWRSGLAILLVSAVPLRSQTDVRHLRKQVRDDPSNVELHYQLGVALAQTASDLGRKGKDSKMRRALAGC